jgi:pilus assembly protein Flp/PilA
VSDVIRIQPAPKGQKEIIMVKNLIKLFKDEEGATALEYALMAAAVAGVIIVVAFLLGGKVYNAINNVAAHIN